MKRNIKFIVLFLMFIPVSVIIADAATEISACGTISVPGTYILNQSIPNSPATPSCINIVSSDVVFDGAGYEIDGIGAEIGVYVRNFPTILTNVTVKNLIVTDWDYGIYYADTNDGIIDNNTVTSIDLYGIPLVNASNNTLTNNTLSSNSQGIYLITSSNYNYLTNNNASFNAIGIYLQSSTNNNLTNNTVNSNTQNGIYFKYDSEFNNLTDNTVNSNNWNGIYIYSSSDYNNLTGNNASSNTYDGIYLYGSSSNTLMNNIASSNERGGIHIEVYNGEGTEYADNNTLLNNTANSNTEDGIYLESSNNNNLTGNTANSNTMDGIYLSSSSDNNLTDNTANSNTDNGIYLEDSNDNIVEDNFLDFNNNGIYTRPSLNPVYGNIYRGNDITNSNSDGIYLEDYCSGNISSITIENNNITDASNGIHIYSECSDIFGFTIRGNNISNSMDSGIYFESDSDYLLHDNLIYNNYLNNDNNFVFRAVNSNVWNTTIISGTNIVDGSYLGGNFWGYPDGTGFSQTCTDGDGNGICDDIYELDADNIDYLPLSLNFSPDTTPPASITNLTAGSTGQTYINWTWTDPTDSDFDYVTVYLNGTFKENISKGVRYYYASDLSTDSVYEIETRTVDTSGNINSTWFNHSARTAPVSTPSSGGSSGSGSGGSGVVSSEPPNNIERVTTTTKDLRANTKVTYSLPNTGGVFEIGIIGKENEGDVAVRVEHLKGLSKQLKEPAPGDVYDYVNINVGTKKINEATIEFAVENSWLEEHNIDESDIKLVKWDGEKWKKLENKTEEGYYLSLGVAPKLPGILADEGNIDLSLDIYTSGTGGDHKEEGFKLSLLPQQTPKSYSFDTTVTGKDEMYTFFEAPTESFSTFAITGIKSVSTIVAMAPPVLAAEATPNVTEVISEKMPKVEPTVILGIIALIGAAVAVQYRRK